MNSIFQFTKRIDLLFKISRIQKFILKRTSLQYKSSVNINSLRKVNFLLFFITKKVYLKRSTMYVDEINQRWFNFVLHSISIILFNKSWQKSTRRQKEDEFPWNRTRILIKMLPVKILSPISCHPALQTS